MLSTLANYFQNNFLICLQNTYPYFSILLLTSKQETITLELWCWLALAMISHETPQSLIILLLLGFPCDKISIADIFSLQFSCLDLNS